MDRFVLEDGHPSPTRILECKTANPFSSGDWGEVGSDEVPMSYLCQCILAPRTPLRRTDYISLPLFEFIYINT
jgi:hypothetical protein